MKRAHIIISGRVQGVFFRSNTKIAADKLGLTGFIRNLDNGDVELVAEGSEEQIKRIITFCKNGPEYAEVANIDISYEEPKKEFTHFDIRY
jgi:acylphosphatase